MRTPRLSFLTCVSSTALILAAAGVAQAHLAASAPAISPAQAQARAARGAVRWLDGQNLSVHHTTKPRCTQLSPAAWRCMETVYCNLAATVTYAHLTIHVWNTSAAPNGAYWSHEHLLANYKVIC